MRTRLVLGQLAAAAALVVAGCAPSLHELETDNHHALARADAAAAAAGTPFTPATIEVADPLPPAAPQPGYAAASASSPAAGAPATLAAAAGWHGLLDSEHVVALRSTGELVLLGGVCVRRGRCGGCSGYAEYRYAHARDGHVVVVRMHPLEEVVASHDDPSCPAGCGGGNPASTMAAQAGMAPPATGARLGITSLAQLEIRDDAYPVKLVETVCTNTTPVP